MDDPIQDHDQTRHVDIPERRTENIREVHNIADHAAVPVRILGKSFDEHFNDNGQ